MKRIPQSVASKLLGVNASTLNSYVATNCNPENVHLGLSFTGLLQCIKFYSMYSFKPSAKCKFLLEVISVNKCESLADLLMLDERHPFKPAKNKRNTKGFVYVISDGSRWYKIGKAKNVKTRIGMCQVGNPNPLILIHSIACLNYTQAESYMHYKYKDVRGMGEWFELSLDQIFEIQAIVKL